MTYKIEFIKGVVEFLEAELQEKFSNEYKILEKKSNHVLIETEVQDIDAFRVLRAALHISLIEGGKVIVERNLFRREWRKHLVPAGINPTLAYVMCKAAALNITDIVMDPFCGGGTIPITALIDFNVDKVLASDISSKAIEYTKRNLVEAKVNKQKYNVFISDVRRLRIQKQYLNKIITNMPFGIRAGKHESNINLYKTFINFCFNSLKDDGLCVILTTEKSLIVESIKNKFEIIEEIKIQQGGLYPSIYKIKKIV